MTAERWQQAPLRLSWGENGPAPYESAWMMFIKLMALNVLTPRDLARLLAKDPATLPERFNPDPVTSDWLHIPRLAEAIGVPGEQVERAFLDQLGLGKLVGTGSVIRHCPQCIQHGFHCVLFQLAILASCPLHGVPLVECKRCTAFRFVRGRRPGASDIDKETGSDLVQPGTALACGHFRFAHSGSTTFPAATNIENEQMAGRCQDILEWIRRAHAGLGQDAQLLDGLWGTWTGPYGTLPQQLPNEAPGVKLSLARGIAGPIPFDVNFRVLGVHEVTGWFDEPGSLDDQTSEDRVHLAYRVVRRHIERRYLAGHRRCTRAFRRFDRWDCLILCGVKVCTPNLAYFAWRMRHEGVESAGRVLDFPTWRRSCPCSTALYGPRVLWQAKSLRAICHLFLVSFLSLWGAIERRCGEESLRLRWPNDGIERSGIPDHLFLKCAHHADPYTTDIRVTASDGLGRCSVALPPRQELISRAAERCSRRSSERELFSVRGMNSVFYWAYVDDQADMFRIWRDSEQRYPRGSPQVKLGV